MLERWFPFLFAITILPLLFWLFTRTHEYRKVPQKKRELIMQMGGSVIAVAIVIGLIHAFG